MVALPTLVGVGETLGITLKDNGSRLPSGSLMIVVRSMVMELLITVFSVLEVIAGGWLIATVLLIILLGDSPSSTKISMTLAVDVGVEEVF